MINEEAITLNAPKADKISRDDFSFSSINYSQKNLLDLDNMNSPFNACTQPSRKTIDNISDEDDLESVGNLIHTYNSNKQKIEDKKRERDTQKYRWNLATEKHLEEKNEKKRKFPEFERRRNIFELHSDDSFENSLDFKSDLGQQTLPTRKKKKCSEADVNAAIMQTLGNIDASVSKVNAQQNNPHRAATNSIRSDEFSHADRLFSETLLIELRQFSPRDKLSLKAKIIDFVAKHITDENH